MTGTTRQLTMGEQIKLSCGDLWLGPEEKCLEAPVVSINYMIYYRGIDHDFQEWYCEGNKEWEPDIVHNYFKKAESFQNEKLLQDESVSNFYGHDGPLTINKMNYTNGQ